MNILLSCVLSCLLNIIVDLWWFWLCTPCVISNPLWNIFYSHPTAQLKSSPTEKDEKEAQSQLLKSDEIQRLVGQARAHFDRKDYNTAVLYLDQVIEVRNSKHPVLPCHYIIGVLILYWHDWLSLFDFIPLRLISELTVDQLSLCVFTVLSDMFLGCGLQRYASWMLHPDGWNGKSYHWPESHVQAEERQHPGLLQAQHHLLQPGRPRDFPRVSLTWEMAAGHPVPPLLPSPLKVCVCVW